MFNTYATAGQICKALAAFKVGDNITLLLETEIIGEGIVEAGALAKIVHVKIKDGVEVPKITENSLDDYYANADKYVFVYDVELDNGIIFECTADEIEKGTISAENIDECKKKKRIMYRGVAILGNLQKALIASLYPLGVVALAVLIESIVPDFFSDRSPSMSIILLIFVVVTICGITLSALKPLGRIRRKRRKIIKR